MSMHHARSLPFVKWYEKTESFVINFSQKKKKPPVHIRVEPYCIDDIVWTEKLKYYNTCHKWKSQQKEMRIFDHLPFAVTKVKTHCSPHISMRNPGETTWVQVRHTLQQYVSQIWYHYIQQWCKQNTDYVIKFRLDKQSYRPKNTWSSSFSLFVLKHVISMVCS